MKIQKQIKAKYRYTNSSSSGRFLSRESLINTIYALPKDTINITILFIASLPSSYFAQSQAMMSNKHMANPRPITDFLLSKEAYNEILRERLRPYRLSFNEDVELDCEFVDTFAIHSCAMRQALRKTGWVKRKRFKTAIK